jgi:hypothetical protein
VPFEWFHEFERRYYNPCTGGILENATHAQQGRLQVYLQFAVFGDWTAELPFSRGEKE